MVNPGNSHNPALLSSNQGAVVGYIGSSNKVDAAMGKGVHYKTMKGGKRKPKKKTGKKKHGKTAKRKLSKKNGKKQKKVRIRRVKKNNKKANLNGGGGGPTILDIVPLDILKVFFNAVIKAEIDKVSNLLNKYPNMPLEMTCGDIFNHKQKDAISSNPVKVDMTPLYFAVSRNMHIPVFNNENQCVGIYGNGSIGKKQCNNYYKVAELLLEKGANPKATTKQWFPGWQPVHWAAEYSNDDMIKLLQYYAEKRGDIIDGNESYLVAPNKMMTTYDYYGEAKRRIIFDLPN